jgi:O-acetyl-ADP-ribose deacetylase (regulator of RNase III)
MQLRQILFTLPIIIAFIFYNLRVQRRQIDGKAIFGVGALLGVLAIGLTTLMLWPFRGQPKWNELLLTNAAIMTAATLWCIGFAYRQARVITVFSTQAEDTEITVLAATIHRIPESDALLLANTTMLRSLVGPASVVLVAAGKALETEVKALAPVKLDKVVVSKSGTLPVKQIIHVAVSEPSKPVDAARLRRGIESAAQQARKLGAATLVVPYAPLRGLSPKDGADAITIAMLHQKKGFTRIVFLAIDQRDAVLIKNAIESALKPQAQAAIK